MSLIKTIQADYLAARYAKDTLKSNLLSTLLGEAQAVGKDAGNRDATDAEVVAVIKKFIKNAEETSRVALASIQINKMDVIQNAANEVKILTVYLPQQMDAEKLNFIVENYLAQTPDANMGHVMGYFKANYAGQYDGQVLATIVKELL